VAVSIGWRSNNGNTSDIIRTWDMTTVIPHRWHSVMVISSMGHWTRWAEKSCKRRKSWQPFPSNGLRQIERRENSTNVLFHYGDRKLSSYEIKSNEIFNDDNSFKIYQNSSNFHPSWIFFNMNSKTTRLSVVGELANQTTRKTRFIAQRWTYN